MPAGPGFSGRKGNKMRNIVLIGLPGSGKSTLGEKAAKAMNLNFIDIDNEVEQKAGLSVSRIFEQHGEEAFREMETEALRRSMDKPGCLIATGGGVVKCEKNIKLIKENGLTIFLDRPVENIIHELSGDESRPLLKNGPAQVYKLSEERRGLYLTSADLVISNHGCENEGLKAVLAAIGAETAADGYAVIGDPIGHSLSPVIHSAVFSALGISDKYRSILVVPERLPLFAERIRSTALKGFNVTIPHKQAIMPMLDKIDEEAALCGAVNTVVNTNGMLTGYNTDMEGLKSALNDCGSGFKGRHVMILGAGGSAGSIAFKAARDGARRICLLARRPEQAAKAAERARLSTEAIIETGALTLQSMLSVASQSDLLLNCTPLGMQGVKDNFQSFDFLDALPEGAVVCDLIYKPSKTNLLLEAEKRGLTVLNGLGMLIHQAILADELYLGHELNKAELYKTAACALERDNCSLKDNFHKLWS